MSTGTSCHFGHLLQVSLKTDFIHFIHDFIHVYSPRAGADSPRGQRFDKCIVTSFTRCKFQKMSSKSDFDFIQFFHDLIHIYSPGAGTDRPQGTKF